MAHPYYDIITTLEGGNDSGIAPLLLHKNQAASIINGTVRGAFAGTRPAFQVGTLTYADPSLQTLVENGLFQGCGYYRPDFGVEQLIAQISGRLFAFTESTTSPDTFAVTDISVPGSPNSATTSQVWMWQSEKWMIIEDGTAALPIFYDGTTSRRSYGPSVLLAVANTFTPSSPPDVYNGTNSAAATVQVTLTAPYTGPFNVPVLMNGAFYQPISGGSGTSPFTAELTNVSETPGATQSSGSQIVVQPSTVGYVTSFVSGSGGFGFGYVNVVMSSTVGLRPGTFNPPNISGDHGDLVTLSGLSINGGAAFTASMYAVSVNPTTNEVRFQATTTAFGSWTVAPGGIAQLVSGGGPNVIVATTTASFVTPAVGGTVIVDIDQEYSGVSGQLVWVNSKQYTIAPAPAPTPSTTLDLLNLSDTSGSPYGATEDILSVPELPAGRMGAYGLGQNWVSLTDGLSFVVSDPVGGASGTPANQYRDAVLKYTELTFRGGAFRIPTSGTIISSMTFTSVLDTSLGQGPLIIGTDSAMYSCIAPVDFTNLPNITGPILTAALIGDGPLGQNSTILVNSDILFRINPGLASLILARREFVTWGNTPISHEMERIFALDDKTLLQYSSSLVFNNRFLVTARPQTGPQGVFHSGLVVMNLDPVSSLRGKAPAVYDGAWSGLNVFQLVSGKINGAFRAFAFTYNVTDTKLELYELLADGVESFDNGVTRIPMTIETAVLFNADVKPINQLCRIVDGELFLQDIVGTLGISVYYKPDFYPCFHLWRTWEICQSEDSDESKPGYRTRIGIGEPSNVQCEEANNRPMNIGHFFQFKIVLTGHAKFMALRVKSVQEPVSDFAAPECAPCS